MAEDATIVDEDCEGVEATAADVAAPSPGVASSACPYRSSYGLCRGDSGVRSSPAGGSSNGIGSWIAGGLDMPDGMPVSIWRRGIEAA